MDDAFGRRCDPATSFRPAQTARDVHPLFAGYKPQLKAASRDAA